MYRTWLGRSHVPGRVAIWIIHGISNLPLGEGSIQGYGVVLDIDRVDHLGLGMYRTWLGRRHYPGTVALLIIHGISHLPLGNGSIQGYGIVLNVGLMGPIFLVWIGQTVWVLE